MWRTFFSVTSKLTFVLQVHIMSEYPHLDTVDSENQATTLLNASPTNICPKSAKNSLGIGFIGFRYAEIEQ